MIEWGIEDEKQFLDYMASDHEEPDNGPLVTIEQRIRNLEGYMIAVDGLRVDNFTDKEDIALLRYALDHIKRLEGTKEAK